MTTGYYNRTERENSDGTPLFAGDYDQTNEDEVQALLEQAWGCTLAPFGRLCPVDFYATRNGRLVGLLELKSRANASNRYPTVFLNVRKWFALTLGSMGLGCPAVFVVKFTDGLRYLPLSEIDAANARIGGTREIVKSHSDIEPVIEVPINQMNPILDQDD